MIESALSRRQLLASATTLVLTGLAGCTDSSDDQSTTGDDSADGNDDDSGGDAGADGGDGTTGDDGSTGTDDSEGSTNDDTEGTARDDSMTEEDSTDGTDGETDDGVDGSGDALDLQEANVVGVSIEERSGAYDFSVSLHHNDDGEDGYANWWQVEQLDGTRLGRRDLTHPHSRQPFTRSDTIDVPDGVTCVVVRGHDQTHGYGGRAILVNVESGSTRAVDQGSDQQSFDGSECP